MKKAEQYIKALSNISFQDPNGPSARMARRLVAAANEGGIRAAVNLAESLRHDSAGLSRGAFSQVVSLCALARLDATGDLSPFVEQDLSPTALKIARG